jgi:gliding motility-associated lipoprotein GldD
MTCLSNKIKLVISILSVSLIGAACNKTPAPKPFGYFRIDLPEREYVELKGDYPFTALIPDYAQIITVQDTIDDAEWYNMVMRSLDATIYLSYHKMLLPLNQYIEDARKLAFNHMQKASAINYSVIVKPEYKVYGLYISIEGNDAATPFQFYLTDSVNNFLRGALYFDHVPNNDSVAPIIKFIKEDIEVFVESFEWSN